jgi:uncharacterized protein
MTIPRTAQAQLIDLARWNACILITGPRQAGKTTLAKASFSKLPYVSLEDPDTRESALSDPRRFLADFTKGAIIDEVQRAPEILSYLQGLIDDARQAKSGKLKQAQWVLTGSQQFGLISKVSQSLAGRVGLLQLLPFSLRELQAAAHPWAELPLEQLLWRGLYPVPVDQGNPPQQWYADYFATYVERDVRQMVNIRDLSAFRTFVRLCAARTAQPVNFSALATDCGVSVNTAKGWLSILEASYIVFTLPQHHVNFGKRLVKAPKMYFFDTGLVAWLTGLRTPKELGLSSMRGALFETWAVSEALKAIYHSRSSVMPHYWRDQAGTEIDLLLDAGATMTPIEFKAGQTIASDWLQPMTKYIGYAKTKAIHPTIIYAGEKVHHRADVSILNWKAYPSWLYDIMTTA